MLPMPINNLQTIGEGVQQSRKLQRPHSAPIRYPLHRNSLDSADPSSVLERLRSSIRKRLCANGKEFVRSRTLPAIPVEKYLQELDVNKSTPPPDRKPVRRNSSVCSQSSTPLLSPDALLPGQIRPRSASVDPRWKRLPFATKGQKGTVWTRDTRDESPHRSAHHLAPPEGGMPQLYYTTPPKSQMATTPTSEERRLERSGSAKGGFSRLARRLSQKERRNNEERKKALRQRSVSLDCGDGRRPLMCPDQENRAREDRASSIPSSPSLPVKLGHSTASGSSSPNLAGRLSRRASSGKSRKTSLDVEGLGNKADKRKKSALDIQALFDAVELQDLDLARNLVENESLDLNSVNAEELTPLDIAILTNHVPMARMLLSYGAKENPRFQKSDNSRQESLIHLVSEAEKKCSDITASSGQQRENDRQLSHWEFRHRLLKRMKAGYDHAKPPDAPSNCVLTVASSSSLSVKFDEPENYNGAVVTRYKIQWSCFQDFNPLAGEQTIEDLHQLQYEITGLAQGNTYYVRIQAWNIRGFGPWTLTTPTSAIPSSWREVDNTQPRADGKLEQLDDLFNCIRDARPADASEIKDSHTPTGSPLHNRRSNMRKSIKNLFSSAPKFQKYLKRGVYLASLLYNEDRILVTNEENLPILEVDENFSGMNLHSDFHWLMKVACTWEDVKGLRQDMEKSSCSSAVLFRSKLLQTAAQLQSALGVQDLGQFYYHPTRDNTGSIVLVTVNLIRDPKQVNTTHVKWMQLNKVQKRLASPAGTVAATDVLLGSVSEMIQYQQASTAPLPRGLYLGYLKLKSSVDLIRVLVPQKMPNVLPYVRVRDCPHVSKEEWSLMRNLSINEMNSAPSNNQTAFQNQVVSACNRLLEDLGITEDEMVSHRLYDLEVIDLSEDVSFILVLPPTQQVCSVPGHSEEIMEQADYLTLPVQIFEMIHMCTYQYNFISRYSRLSSILEMDTLLAQQAQREAFSSEELAIAKKRVELVSQFQQRLDEAWKGMRWIMDIITYARDKSVRGGLPLGVLYAPPASPEDSPQVDRRDLDSVVSSSNSDMGYHSDRSSGDHNFQSQISVRDPSGSGEPLDVLNLGDQASFNFEPEGEVWTKASNQPGVLRVYAAYETGLAKGTSVKLHVTPRTTAREVINLVVQQLNKAVSMKGLEGPIYFDEMLEEFCLVAVIGARERVLRDDYQPLQLQNPWTKGRLFVRLKSNLLAALEQGHVTSV